MATKTKSASTKSGALDVIPFSHPQGCRTYLICDPKTRQALAIDPHLDLVDAVASKVRENSWSLPFVVDTHTHADHPSGAAALAARFGSTRVAHELAGHAGVTRHPRDGDTLQLGDQVLRVRHAPGHTPDSLVLIGGGALFSGDSLFIGSVARTDFLGGDAGQLFDSIHRVLNDLDDETVLYPGHDYAGQLSSTIGAERATNPWLRIGDRAAFVRALTADPPPQPANMEDLLRFNRTGVDIPTKVSADDAVARVRAGGAGSVIDVRTVAEVESEHIAGSRHVPVDQVRDRADEIRATPAPRLILCRSGMRAENARRQLQELGIGGLSVVEGGILAYAGAGGVTLKGKKTISLERQVRIAAGALIVVGAVLGFAVHPVLHLLSALVGGGLVFAGITDRCGMAMLLAKMPWNARAKASPAAPAAACAAKPPAAACAAKPPGS
jgi:glyoxylase-like metal-dependent hydrolase (beta-lactamase superfamily II)/rhodanese-related sulfurtransferase